MSNPDSCKTISKSDQRFLRRRFFRISSCMYSAKSPHSPQPCLWMDQISQTVFEKGSPKEHSYEIISKSDQQYKRRFLAHLSTTCSRGAFRVVRCPSCVINNFFKHLLLPNCWASLDQTWQECSLGGPLQKLFTEIDSIKNSGCHGIEIEFFKQFFKNLLLLNRWSNFEIISHECSLGDPFQNLLTKF